MIFKIVDIKNTVNIITKQLKINAHKLAKRSSKAYKSMLQYKCCKFLAANILRAALDFVNVHT